MPKKNLQYIGIFGMICLLAYVKANDEFDEVPSPDRDVNSFSDEEEAEEEPIKGEKKSFFEVMMLNLKRSGDMAGKNDFTGEFLFLGFIVIWALCYLYGRTTNERIAVCWMNAYKDLFSNNFSFMSSGNEAEPDPNALLHRETRSQYSFFASGRVNCSGLVADITLLKRHDMIMRVVDALAFPFYDKVTIQIPLSDKIDSLFLFALCRKGTQENIRTQRREFQDFAPQVISPHFSSSMILMCEAPDAISQVFDSKALKILNDLEDMVELICFSDLNGEPVEGFADIPAKVLTFSFRFGNSQDPEKMRPLVELAIQLVDIFARLKLSGPSKNKVDKDRKILTDRVAKKLQERQKEEAAQKKLEKEEQIRAKEKLEYENLSTEAKLKRDLKEEKRKKKEEKSRQVKMVKK